MIQLPDPAIQNRPPPSDPRDQRPFAAWICSALGLFAMLLAFVSGAPPLGILVIGVALVCILTVLITRESNQQNERQSKLHRETVEEISHWREHFRALEQEAQQATSSLSLLRYGVVMLSSKAEIVLINPAARRLLNLSSDIELQGRPLSEVVRIPEVNRATLAAISGDGTQKLLVEIPSGEMIRPVYVRVDRFQTGGEHSLLMGLRDETEAHRVEEMRREFIANISHELKTPLAAIKGYAETVELAIKDDPDAAFHFMQQIYTQCLRLEKLIAGMMQLARAQAGISELELAPVSLSDVIQESLKSYHPVADAKHIQLTVTPCDDLPAVHADAEATLTIASNLIGNAIHYTPEGGEVHVHCRPAGKFVALVVEDNGVGIPKSEQKRIFERFYRVEKSRDTEVGGTGIGLSIVKNLAMTQGGEVRVSSKPGEGARFEVLLPVSRESLLTP
ncbi:MAG: ATP-binding protein [Rubripirellula sp.]